MPQPAPGLPTQPALRLPAAEDLGPNYFELFAVTAEAGSDEGRAAGVGAAVVGFGFSERAKLPDERIERDGPLAVVARMTEHPNPEEASQFAAAAGIGAHDLSWPDAGGAAGTLGLTGALAGSPPTRHELAPELTGIRTLGTGWLTGLDGMRVSTVLETWASAYDRTVLTVTLVWRGSADDMWGATLLRRLVQSESEQAVARAA